MLKIENKFKISLLLILLIIFNSIYSYAAPSTDIGDNNNIAPKIDLNVTPVKKPVDIVIMTDYTGTKLTALNTQINSLKAQFDSVNVDPKFHIVSDIKNIGNQNDELYEFVRYGHFNYKVTGYARFKDYGLEESYTNYTVDEYEEWERITGLISQYANLPVRNPKNVTFTKGPMLLRDTASVRQFYHEIVIKCTNDVKTSSSVLIEERYYRNSNSGIHRIYNASRDYKNESFGLISEWAAIDTTWTVDRKVSDVSYDIYSLDFDKLNAIPLRVGSDRHMIFISDASAKDYSQPFGNYFSFGDLTDSVKNYIKQNNFSVYGVASEKARHNTLYPDKVKDIETYGLFTIFRMENGDILKLGNRILAEQLNNGEKMYPEVLSSFSFDSVKKVLYYSSYIYYLMNDGTLKIGTQDTPNFVTEDEITGIKDITLRGYSGLWILTNSGQIYRYQYGVEKFPMIQYGVKFDRILLDGKIFLTADGIPYGVFNYYDGQWERNKIERYRKHYEYYDENYREWRTSWSYLGAIKDAVQYHTGALVQYPNNTVEKFEYIDTMRIDDKYDNHNDYPSMRISLEKKFTEANVESISSTYYAPILHKTNGTTRMVVYDPETDSMVSEPMPFNNASPIYTNIYGFNFYMDGNNKVYKFVSNTAEQLPDDSEIVNLGTIGADIVNIVKYGNAVYIVYTDGRLLKMEYKSSPSPGLVESIPYTDVKNVYTCDWQIYILKNDGSVLGMGNTGNGQLGRKGTNITSFINPFHNVLTFDTTKSYYSLKDLFNEITNSKFYPAGGYAAAFNDIYKNYSYSTSGNTYVLLGDDIRYESVYSDYENDPEYSRKWLISHDPYHFDNSMGLSAYHKPAGFTANPPAKLDKVGKYLINLKARDNPKSNLKFLNDSNEDKNYYKWSLGDHNLTVYVHRKPVALQRVSITNNGDGTYTAKAYDAGSYDPDHSVTGPDKGITAREWRWKEKTSAVWTEGQMNKTDCIHGESYITQLRVKDVEGVWSDYAAITIDRNNPPAALFTIDKTLISTSELLKVKDMSFPQSFSSITDWHWIIKRLNADGSVPGSNIQDAKFTNSNTGTGTLAGYDKNVKYSYSSTGKYRIYLRVKDSNGLWSDGGTDSAPVLDSFCSQDIAVDSPPTASFIIEKNPIFVENTLQLRDTSTATGISPVSRWHWIVKKLNADGSVPAGNIQNEIFNDSNTGTGSMAGYDVNVKTSYADKGPGTYRIYLRVMNGNGMWSDGGTDSTYNLNGFFHEDLVVQESFKMSNFRVVRIRDLHLEPYYEYNGEYIDRPFYVNSMAIDQTNFIEGGISAIPGFSSLTKGYRFEFEIDTVNFNEANDTIEIEPSFYSYTPGVPGVRGPQSDLYWEDSNKEVHKAGEGGHSSWAKIVLDESSRTITGENEATWRGEYFIPATSWLVPPGTSAANAKAGRINADIIVNFTIIGYRDGEMKYDYNLQQWPIERTEIKHPYEIGDVIRYDHTKNSLDDINIIINRP